MYIHIYINLRVVIISIIHTQLSSRSTSRLRSTREKTKFILLCQFVINIYFEFNLNILSLNLTEANIYSSV